MATRPFITVDPRTGNFVRRGSGVGPGSFPLGPSPVRSRRFRGFGDVPPSQSGAQGALIAPYDETTIFNPGPQQGGAGASVVSSPNSPTPNPAQTGFLPPSAPFGESDRPWSNPTTFATVPINAATSISVPVLSQNFQRNALIIQNGSTATGTDVAPTLYIGFNAQPIVGLALALAPGQGIAWDIITPRDSVYIAFGPFINTGLSVVIQGAVLSGTYTP